MAADASRMIDRQLAHMVRLLDDLLDVSRITRGALEIRRETLDLRATVMQSVEAARPLALAASIACRRSCRSTRCRFAVMKRGFFKSSETSLVIAIKFTPPGGWIRLSASIEDAMVVVRRA